MKLFQITFLKIKKKNIIFSIFKKKAKKKYKLKNIKKNTKTKGNKKKKLFIIKIY